MSEPLVIETERPGVILRQLATPADDQAFFDAVQEDPRHLSRHGEHMSLIFATPEAVTQRRLKTGNELRFGVWDADADKPFTGSIGAYPSPDGSEVEIGFWLRESAQHKGYATLALNALTQYLRPNYSRIYAEVHPENEASMRVLGRAGYVRTGVVERKWALGGGVVEAVVFEPAGL